MGQEITTTPPKRDRLTIGVLAVTTIVGIALLALAATGVVRLQVAAGVLQVLGIVVAAFGLDVVRASLQRAADTATAAKNGVARWVAVRREQLTRWWLRVRHHQVVSGTSIQTLGTIESAGRITVARGSGPVDRETISDREWLAYLDDHVTDLRTRMSRAEQSRSTDSAELEQRLADDHDKLRGDIVRATRQGWELIIAGLVLSAAGTFVGIWA